MFGRLKKGAMAFRTMTFRITTLTNDTYDYNKKATLSSARDKRTSLLIQNVYDAAYSIKAPFTMTKHLLGQNAWKTERVSRDT
jgi:hypothetical protein